MKSIFFLLLVFSNSVFSTEIYKIKTQPTGFIISGIGLQNINKIKLGGKFLKIETKNNNYIIAICKKPNKFPCSDEYYFDEGTYLLQIYKNKLFKETFINIPKRQSIVLPNIPPGDPVLPPETIQEPGLPILP